MDQALIEAKKAFALGEVPVGSVLTYQNKIIARSHNQMETMKDPSAHAELLCIRKGSEFFGDWRLIDTVLYTTLEPCLMCAGAIFLARIKKVVWGARDIRHGANGSFVDVFEKKYPTHNVVIEGGVRSIESGQLMRGFFKKRREEVSKKLK